MKNKPLITIFILISVICFCVYLDRLEIKQYESKRKFKIGEIVKTKLDDRKGMIIGIYLRDNYTVRFVTNSAKTNTKILSKDRDIIHSPYSVVKMKEFELEKIKAD
jgi:hypothetical protein